MIAEYLAGGNLKQCVSSGAFRLGAHLIFRASEMSVTSFTFLRDAISSAIEIRSAGDNSRAATGKTRWSSTLICCRYMDESSATAWRKDSDSCGERLPIERYREPRRSTSWCKGLALRWSFSSCSIWLRCRAARWTRSRPGGRRPCARADGRGSRPPRARSPSRS